MKRPLTLVSILVSLLLCLSACQTSAAPDTTLSGSAAELMPQLLDALDFETFDEPITNDNVASYTGLTSQELATWVQEGQASQAAISVNPHLVVILQCVDQAAASQAKEAIAERFDPYRWICVIPDQVFVADSGPYVLLVSSDDDTARQMAERFVALAGPDTAEPDVFFKSSEL